MFLNLNVMFNAQASFRAFILILLFCKSAHCVFAGPNEPGDSLKGWRMIYVVKDGDQVTDSLTMYFAVKHSLCYRKREGRIEQVSILDQEKQIVVNLFPSELEPAASMDSLTAGMYGYSLAQQKNQSKIEKGKKGKDIVGWKCDSYQQVKKYTSIEVWSCAKFPVDAMLFWELFQLSTPFPGFPMEISMLGYENRRVSVMTCVFAGESVFHPDEFNTEIPLSYKRTDQLGWADEMEEEGDYLSVDDKEREANNPTPDTATPAVLTEVEFREMSIDLGEMDEGDTYRHTFEFINTSGHPLKIKNVIPSCRCIRTLYSKEEIPPGATGNISVEFYSAGKSGLQTKTIRVEMNVPESPFVLQIQANVKDR